MFTVAYDSRSVNFTLESNPSFVQPLIKHFEQIAKEWGVDNAGRIVIVLRELLCNAIGHGNRNQPSLLVHCRIERTPEGPFWIVVQDEGNGFDFTSLDMSFPEDPRNMRKRGYILVRKICRHLEFNASGNRVSVLVDAADRQDAM